MAKSKKISKKADVVVGAPESDSKALEEGTLGEGTSEGETTLRNDSEASDDDSIVTSPRTFNLGTDLYISGGEVSFGFAEGKRWVEIMEPVAAKTIKEGGTYYRVEIYYKLGEIPFGGMSQFDNKSFVIKLGQDPETGKVLGRVFDRLKCIGRVYDKLDAYPGERFVKFICNTPNQVYWRGFQVGDSYNIKWNGLVTENGELRFERWRDRVSI